MRDLYIHQAGGHRVTIGGVKLLADFSTEQILLRASGVEITITGEGLQIERFDENEIEIIGTVTNIATQYLSKSRRWLR